MEIKRYNESQIEQIEQIIDFLLARAKGDVPTGAKFIREYILQHPLYKNDSKLSPCLMSALVQQIIKLNHDDGENLSMDGPHQDTCECEQVTEESKEEDMDEKERELKIT